MQKFIGPIGEIQINDAAGIPIQIGSFQHGISYSRSNKLSMVTRVTIKPNYNSLSDVFFFAPGEESFEIIFRHLMTRETNPELNLSYLMFFKENKNYTPLDFVTYVIKNYFIKELGYQINGENTDLITPN